MDDYQRMEETAPWWFPAALMFAPFSIMLFGAFAEIFYFSLLGAGLLGFVCGSGITLASIFKSKTGYDIDDLAQFDAIWHVFIVQRRNQKR